jgi:two-component system, chemotaxis family, response regulator Rcp1
MEITKSYQPIEILLVEDNPGDVRLIQEVMKEGKVLNNLTVARDGVDAKAILESENRKKPDMILLDLNLPRKNGLELLTEIKTNPKLKRIPVIVLSTSSAENDIASSYDLHANAYLTKPVELDEFILTVQSIEKFWLSVVKYPSKKDPS